MTRSIDIEATPRAHFEQEALVHLDALYGFALKLAPARDEIVRAIDSLPDEYRSAVVLSDIQELRYAEIAQILGIPEGTVKSRLFRGRRLLQRKLRDYAETMGYVKSFALAS